MSRQSLFALSLGLGALLLATQHAFAEGAKCAPRDKVLAALAQRHGETRRAIGLAANGRVMELFANAESRSWTLTLTLPSGVTCLIGAGHAFEPVADALPPQGDPA